jgi:hypothetical protein
MSANAHSHTRVSWPLLEEKFFDALK